MTFFKLKTEGERTIYISVFVFKGKAFYFYRVH